MIKINLIKQSASSSASAGSKPFDGGGASASSSLDIGDAQGPSWLIKFLIIILGVVGLVAYENYNLPILRAERGRQESILRKLKEENARVPGLVEEIKRFNEEKIRLEAQIQAIEDLSKTRMSYIKALDLIQQKLPQKLWLTNIRVNSGRLVLEGVAATEAEISEFIGGISKSILFSEVNLLIAEDDRKEKSQVKNKTFSIECIMEKT